MQNFGAQQLAEASLAMPIPMNYGSIHESSKFRMLCGPSVHSTGSSSIQNGLVAPVQSSTGATVPAPPRPPLTATPPLPPPPPATSQSAHELEESLAAAAAGHPAAATPANNSEQQVQLMMGPLPNSASQANLKRAAPVKYRECLKNHAANIGGHALDGCGEFMPGGEEGSVEALKCAACGCHRNFHRREVEGEPAAVATGGCGFCAYSPAARAQLQISIKDQSRRRFAPLAALPPHPPLALPPPSPAPVQGPPRALAPLHMALHSPPDTSMTADDQSSDPHLHIISSSTPAHAASMHLGMMQHHHHFVGGHSTSSSKKRFRTRFNSEQKDRMFSFAEKLGWRIQKHDEVAVHQFCADVGVKRHVFKVWMHNNKNTFARKILPNEGGSVAYLDNSGSSPTTSSGMQP